MWGKFEKFSKFGSDNNIVYTVSPNLTNFGPFDQWPNRYCKFDYLDPFIRRGYYSIYDEQSANLGLLDLPWPSWSIFATAIKKRGIYTILNPISPRLFHF